MEILYNCFVPLRNHWECILHRAQTKTCTRDERSWVERLGHYATGIARNGLLNYSTLLVFVNSVKPPCPNSSPNSKWMNAGGSNLPPGNPGRPVCREASSSHDMTPYILLWTSVNNYECIGLENRDNEYESRWSRGQKTVWSTTPKIWRFQQLNCL